MRIRVRTVHNDVVKEISEGIKDAFPNTSKNEICDHLSRCLGCKVDFQLQTPKVNSPKCHETSETVMSSRFNSLKNPRRPQTQA